MLLNRGSEQEKAVPLAQIDETGSYIVESVSGPEQQRLRLCELGIVAGTPVSVLSCAQAGMRTIRVGGCRMALSHGTTEHIWVQTKKM